MSAEAIWAGWLVLFLIYEIVGAVSEKGKPARFTLSRNVWDWFGVRTPRPFAPARRIFLAAFMGVLSCHFVFGEPGAAGVIVAGIPVAVVIAYAIAFEREAR
jgi:hypothetical protein